MIRLSYLLFFTICVSGNVYSQIPNGDFEQWSDFGDWEDPHEWFTMNATFGGDPETVRSTGDAITGETAVRMENGKDDDDNVVRAMMVTGANALNNHPGFPYGSRPATFIGYYQWKPKNDDSCYVMAYLTRYNTNTQQRELIASALFSAGDEVDNYDVFFAPFQYVSPLFPDSAYVVVYSGKFNGPQEDSRLIIDALSFDESATDIAPIEAHVHLQLFPNPAKELVTIQFPSKSAGYSLHLSDLTGKTVKVISRLADQRSFTVTDLRDGYYFYSVIDDDQKTVETGKLIIRK